MSDTSEPDAAGGESLFKRIGGYEAVDAAVERFYAKVIADERVRTFFMGVDMPTQIRKQRRFLAHVFGGPAPWDGKALRHAHRHMKLDEGHFAAVAGHLQATMVELGLAPELVGEVMAIAASTHDDVLDR